VTLDLDGDGLNMIAALVFGSVIGMERQVRQRVAGVRTNALVALAAASFVVFSTLFESESSPTRVAAQVVSGIGFLGAGVIFRDGFTVHGLNTAATLWCAAAVGVMCGIGALPYALMVTLLVMAVNLGLRPLIIWFDRIFLAGQPPEAVVHLSVVYAAEDEAEMRPLVLRKLTLAALTIRDVDQRPVPDGLCLTLQIKTSPASETEMDKAVALLAAERGLRHVGWQKNEE
jgi:putative Mg2+ transporter-C (MgtC) family protein